MVAQSVSVPTPRVARLAGGGSVVLWAAGRQVWAQRTDAAGQFLGSAFAVGPANLEDIPDFSVAAAADGGFIVAWEIEDGPQVTQFGTVQALQVTRFGADGTVQNDVRVNDGHYNSFTGRPIVKATADGGFVVAWTAKSLLPAPSWGYLQRLASDGSRVGPLVTLGGAAPRLAQLTPIPLADGSVLAAWLQSDSTTSGGSTYSVYTQRFGTDSAPVADAVRVEAASGTASFPFDAAALSNGNVALAWIAHDAPGLYQVRSTLLTAAGTSAAAVETYDWPYTIWELPYVAVAPLADGFGVAWQALQSYNRGTIGEIWLQRHAGTGAASQAPTKVVGLSTADFSPTTGHVAYASPGFSLDGGADGHFISAFQSIPATAYLMGQ
ncbi:MAG: hypothetical protein ACXWJJ_07075 [Ramlibacter sp.]